MITKSYPDRARKLILIEEFLGNLFSNLVLRELLIGSVCSIKHNESPVWKMS